jgi:hypothetical protein
VAVAVVEIALQVVAVVVGLQKRQTTQWRLEPVTTSPLVQVAREE